MQTLPARPQAGPSPSQENKGGGGSSRLGVRGLALAQAPYSAVCLSKPMSSKAYSILTPSGSAEPAAAPRRAPSACCPQSGERRAQAGGGGASQSTPKSPTEGGNTPPGGGGYQQTTGWTVINARPSAQPSSEALPSGAHACTHTLTPTHILTPTHVHTCTRICMHTHMLVLTRSSKTP